ncbi:hypothetical protein Tco_1455447 [Tanacetum coccineum]
MVIVMEKICPELAILETRSITKTLNVMMNHAMIVGEDGKAMRLTTTIMMNENMGMKLMMKGMSYMVIKLVRMDGPRERNIDEYWWRIYKYGDLEVLESLNFKAAVQHEFLLNKPTWRIYRANIRGVSHSNSF